MLYCFCFYHRVHLLILLVCLEIVYLVLLLIGFLLRTCLKHLLWYWALLYRTLHQPILLNCLIPYGITLNHIRCQKPCSICGWNRNNGTSMIPHMIGYKNIIDRTCYDFSSHWILHGLIISRRVLLHHVRVVWYLVRGFVCTWRWWTVLLVGSWQAAEVVYLGPLDWVGLFITVIFILLRFLVSCILVVLFCLFSHL